MNPSTFWNVHTGQGQRGMAARLVDTSNFKGAGEQVVVAVDDSRSMAENRTGGFAVEACTLLLRSLARLEVGEVAVLRYGGSGAIAPLHPLSRPFSDADGPRVLSNLRFDKVSLSWL
jgi:midasin (ATPase involved in ribosome maturation)